MGSDHSGAAVPAPRHVEVNRASLTYDDVSEGPAIMFIHGS
jgi:hypothetical protein